jgi:hypothetical protein
MRNFRLTLWHMLLVVAIVLATAVAMLAGMQALAPQWQAPWLLPLLVLVAIDSMITQWLVERERRSWTEQGAIRAAEALLLIISVRVVSLAAEDVPLQTIQPWLRDPLTFFSGRFAEYMLITFIVWSMTALLTHALLALDIELVSIDLDNQLIEKAGVLEDRALALARFDKLWMIYTCLALVGAGLALQRTPLMIIIRSWSALQPLLAVLICIICGLVLHSQASMYQQQYHWQIDRVIVGPEVPRRWRRASWLLIVMALGIGVLVGSFIHDVPPPPPLGPVFNLLLALLALLVGLVLALISLLVLPFALLLAWLRGEALPPPRLNFPPPEALQQPGERPLLPAFIFWACVVLLVVIAGLRYLQQRQDIRAMLGRWRGWNWLLRLWGEAWTDIHGWSEQAWAALQQRFRHSRRVRRARPVRPSGGRAQIRALYRRMVHTAARQGVLRQPAQTPYEFNTTLGARVPAVRTDAQELTDAYVIAEYGPQLPRPDQVRHAHRVWRRINRVLSRARRRR